jgi:uncharacterized protein
VASDRHRFVVNVAELLRRPATRKDVEVEATVHGITVVDSRVPDGSTATGTFVLESLSDGIVVTGTVSAPWTGPCRRCLVAVEGVLRSPVDELFQAEPNTEDAFELHGDQLDLEPVVREALLLELPLAPLCRPDCAGLCPVCGANRNDRDCGHTEAPIDHRWSALEGLREQLTRPEQPEPD